jgi:Ca2+-binding EF-hand superfamily protein
MQPLETLSLGCSQNLRQASASAGAFGLPLSEQSSLRLTASRGRPLRSCSFGPLSPVHLPCETFEMRLLSTASVWAERVRERGRIQLDSAPLPGPPPHELAERKQTILKHLSRQVHGGRERTYHKYSCVTAEVRNLKRRLRLSLIALIALVMCIGCRPSAAPPPIAKAKPPSVPPAKAAVPPSKADTSKEPKKPKKVQPIAVEQPAPTPTEKEPAKAESAKAEPANKEPAAATPSATVEQKPSDPTQLASATTPSVLKAKDSTNKATATEDAPAVPVEPAERILLLTPGGPLVIDVILQLEGQNFEEALGRLADDAFKTADEDGDGKTTWEDLANNPRFRSGEFGNLVADTEEERRQLIRIYDADNDQMVDREELPRFLTRNAGGGKSFALRSSNEYRGTNRRRSATRLLIDDDRDGAITDEELAAAPTRLLNRDADNDEIVVLAEVKDTAVEMMQAPGMMGNRRRVTEPDTAVWLTDKSMDISKRWGMVQFQLQELYSFGEQIVPGDWPLTPELFKTLDEDADGELTKTEFPKLKSVTPHFVLELDFEAKEEKDRSPKLKLRQIASELMAMKPVVRELRSRISIQLPNTEVELFVNQDATLTNVAETVKAQFAAFDRNKNGYWEKDEVPEQIPGVGVSFAQLDSDKDDKVYEKEVAAYLEQRVAVTRAQVRARASDQEDALFTALDTDGDGRLNTREIRLAPSKLKTLDQNQDGKLQSDEIPGSMVIGFIRGNPQQDAQLLSSNALVAPAADASLPRWFRGMDANVDGEISPREFFGTAVKFTSIDKDADGYITIEEGKAFDASNVAQPLRD